MTVGIVVAAVTSMVLTNKAATQVLMVRNSWAVMVLAPWFWLRSVLDR